MLTTGEALDATEAFNARLPIGGYVLHTPRFGWGAQTIERTRGPAYVLHDRFPHVAITNKTGPARLDDVEPVEDSMVLPFERPLLRCANAFGLILHKDPMMGARQGSPNTVDRVVLDPHPPDFAVLLFQVLKWKRDMLAALDTEGIEQVPYVLRLHEAADIIFLLGLYTKLFIQLVRCLELAHFRGDSRWLLR